MKKLHVALALAALAFAALASTGPGREDPQAQGVFAAPAMPWTHQERN